MKYQLLRNNDNSYAVTVPLGSFSAHIPSRVPARVELREIAMPDVGQNLPAATLIVDALNENYEKEQAEKDYIDILRRSSHEFMQDSSQGDGVCRCGWSDRHNIHSSIVEESSAKTE